MFLRYQRLVHLHGAPLVHPAVAATAASWASFLVSGAATTNPFCDIFHSNATALGEPARGENLARSTKNAGWSNTDAMNAFVMEGGLYDYSLFAPPAASGCRSSEGWAGCGHYTQVRGQGGILHLLARALLLLLLRKTSPDPREGSPACELGFKGSGFGRFWFCWLCWPCSCAGVRLCGAAPRRWAAPRPPAPPQAPPRERMLVALQRAPLCRFGCESLSAHLGVRPSVQLWA